MNNIKIGLDLGGSKILALAMSMDGTVLGRAKRPTNVGLNVEAMARQMKILAQEAVAQAGAQWAEVNCMGVAVPASVDQASGFILHSPALGWKNVQARSVISHVMERAVLLENDVNCGVWGEYRLGAGRGCSSMVGYFVGTGLGGGIIIDGKLLRGCRGVAGELGHEIIKHEGRRCGCGHRGCVEAYCSKTAFCKQFEKMIIEKGMNSVLKSKGLKRIKSSMLAEAYRDGDAVTRTVVDRGMTMLGVASANITAAVGPERIIYGGGVMEAFGELLLPVIQASFNEHLFGLAPENVRLAISELGDDAVPAGAALLAQETM